MPFCLIGTPIGNLKDLSPRTREALEGMEILLCEDSRVTAKLLRLAKIGNRPHLESFWEKNERDKESLVLGWLRDKKRVGLVVDAGMPVISDPGWNLLSSCLREGIEVEVLPGPVAFLPALLLSAFPVDKFIFWGFLPKKKRKRRESLARILPLSPITVLLYENPKRVETLLKEMEKLLPQSQVALVWEISKRHERVQRGVVGELLRELEKDRERRGELVVVWRI